MIWAEVVAPVTGLHWKDPVASVGFVHFIAIGAISLLSCQDWARCIKADCCIGEAGESHHRPINVLLQNATSYHRPIVRREGAGVGRASICADLHKSAVLRRQSPVSKSAYAMEK